MSTLSPHARKALFSLRRNGWMITESKGGMTVWRGAKKSKGLGLAWQPVRGSESFMPSAIEELSRAGRIIWEAEDRVRLAEEDAHDRL
jgi:hypothetical protein